MVTGNTYRHPVVLAKMAVTVDHLSGGRLEFGIGAAWAEAEHQMYGVEGLDHRVGRLRESLEAIISLWTNERNTRWPLLPLQRRCRQSEANPETASSDLDRRRRRPDDEAGGTVRRCLEQRRRRQP